MVTSNKDELIRNMDITSTMAKLGFIFSSNVCNVKYDCVCLCVCVCYEGRKRQVLFIARSVKRFGEGVNKMLLWEFIGCLST